MSTQLDGRIESSASIHAARVSASVRVANLSDGAAENGHFLRLHQVYLNFCKAVTSALF